MSRLLRASLLGLGVLVVAPQVAEAQGRERRRRDRDRVERRSDEREQSLRRLIALLERLERALDERDRDDRPAPRTHAPGTHESPSSAKCPCCGDGCKCPDCPAAHHEAPRLGGGLGAGKKADADAILVLLQGTANRIAQLREQMRGKRTWEQEAIRQEIESAEAHKARLEQQLAELRRTSPPAPTPQRPSKADLEKERKAAEEEFKRRMEEIEKKKKEAEERQKADEETPKKPAKPKKP